MNDTFVESFDIYDPRARDVQKIRRSLAGTRRVLGAARTRVHASHGGAHGAENRREKVPKSARARTAVQREKRRGKRRQQQQQQQQRWWWWSGDEGGGEGGAGGSEQKGAPSSEATVRTRRGIASHTGPSAGTGPDRDRNSPDPRALRPTARARARDRDNDRREPHTRLAHVRAARAVNTNRVFFILGATSLFLLLIFLLLHRLLLFLLPLPPRSATNLLLVFPSFFLRAPTATATSPARGDFALFSPVFHYDTFAAF